MIVNVAGGLAAGSIAAFLVGRSAGGSDAASLFLLTGVLGGFTTFSAFSLDAVLLWQRGAGSGVAAYVLGSVLLSIAAVAAGFGIVRALS
jgi:CrcB protein